MTMDARVEKAVAAGMGAVSLRPLNASSIEDACRSAIEAYRKAEPVAWTRFEVTLEEAEKIARKLGWEDASPSAAKGMIDEVLSHRTASEQPRAWTREMAEALVSAFQDDKRDVTYAVSMYDVGKAVFGALAPVVPEQPPKAEVELPTRDDLLRRLTEEPDSENVDHVLSPKPLASSVTTRASTSFAVKARPPMAEQLALTARDDRVHGHAEFDDSGEYRYTLDRWWGDRERRSHIVWIGLNPSTAGATGEDATSRRFLSFTKAFGGKSYTTVNLFAKVSTDPFGLLDDPVGSIGSQNNDWIASETARAALVIACWGAPSDARLRRLVNERVDVVLGVLKNRNLYCLGTTKDGAPRHPLYLSGAERPRLWRRHA